MCGKWEMDNGYEEKKKNLVHNREKGKKIRMRGGRKK